MNSYPSKDVIIHTMESYGIVTFGDHANMAYCTVKSTSDRVSFGNMPYHRTSYRHKNYGNRLETPAEAAYHDLYCALLHCVDNITEGRYD